MKNLVSRRAFLAFLAALSCLPAGADPVEPFRRLSSEVCGVPLDALEPGRARRLLAELGTPPAQDWQDTAFLDYAERLANAWYGGWDGLAWGCPRGVQPPTACNREPNWWQTPR